MSSSMEKHELCFRNVQRQFINLNPFKTFSHFLHLIILQGAVHFTTHGHIKNTCSQTVAKSLT